MSTKRTFVAMYLVQYLMNKKGCVPQSGTFTLRLPGLKQDLALYLSAKYPGFCSRGEIDQALWQEVQTLLTNTTPNKDYFLSGETVGKLHNGWTGDWFFTNDPLILSMHTRADLDATVNRFINGLPRFTFGSSDPYVAGIFHRMGAYVHDTLVMMYENLPLMMTEARDKTATWRSLYDTITDVKSRTGIDGQHGHEIGQALWDLFSGPAAAAPPLAQVP